MWKDVAGLGLWLTREHKVWVLECRGRAMSSIGHEKC